MGTVLDVAVQFFADRLTRIGSDVGDRVDDIAATRLYELIDRKLRTTVTYRAAFESDGIPKGPDRRAAIRATLQEALVADKAFGNEVAALLQQLNLLQPDSSVHNPMQSTHFGTRTRVTRTVIATGSVDQSRRTWKSGSAVPMIVAIIVLAALGTAGGVTVFSNGSGGNVARTTGGDSVASAAVDVKHIGTDPSESGVREAQRAFYKAVATGDVRTACLLISYSISSTIAGGCETGLVEALDRIAAEVLHSYENCQIASVAISNTEGYPTALVKDCTNTGSSSADIWSFETGRWLFDGVT